MDINKMDNLQIGFYNLDGTNLSEKTKSFSLYLKHIKSSLENVDQQRALILSLRPRTYLEKTFKLDMLIYFKLFPELWKVIEDGEQTLVAKLLKSRWFFQELTRTVNPEDVVNRLFVITSLSTRLKIVNCIIAELSTGDYGDKLFDAFDDKYGIHSAKILLPVCTLQKIKSVISSNNVKLTPSITKKIIVRSPQLTEFLFCSGKACNVSVVRFAAQYDPKLVVQLLEHNNSVRYNFGRRQTHAVIASYKSAIMEDPIKFLQLLKFRQLPKSLGRKLFHQFFLSIFSNVVDPASDGPLINQKIIRLLKLAPKNKRLEMISQAVRQVFNTSILKNPDVMSIQILDLIDDVSEREQFAEQLYKDRIDFVAYLRGEKSIPILKQKISLSTNKKMRENLIKLLVKTCKLNNDTKLLLEVLKYVIDRHRNDIFSVRLAFIATLTSEFEIEQLNKEHWKYIDQIMTVFELNKDEHCYLERDISKKRIINHLHNHLPIKQLLENYIEKYGTDMRTLNEIKNMGKLCLLELLNMWPCEKERTKLSSQNSIGLFQILVEWNKDHQHDQIDICSLLSEVLQSIKYLIGLDIEVNGIFEYLIFERNLKHACDLFWSQNPMRYRISIIHLLLKNDPHNVLQNIKSEKLLCVFLKSCEVLYLCKKYSHIGIPEKLVALAQKKLQNDNYDGHEVALQILSHFVDAKEFCTLLQQYYPKQYTVDIDSEKSRKLYEVQVEAIKSIRNLTIPTLALSTLMHFAVGDYLKVSLPLICSLFCKCPEDNVLSYIEELQKRPVSVRKHAFYLGAFVLSKTQFKKLLQDQTKSEKPVSMQVHLFNVTRQYVLKNPCRDSFECLIHFIKRLDHKDEEAFKTSTNLSNFPKKYLGEYVELIWNILESAESKDTDLNICEMKSGLLETINLHDIILLPNNLSEKIIVDNFITHNKIKNINSFVGGYALLNEFPENRLKFVFEVVNQRKQDLDELNFLKIFNEFTKVIYSLCLKNDVSCHVLRLFGDYWCKVVNIVKMFDEYIKLRIAISHHESTEADNYLLTFSKEVSKFIDEVVIKFDVGILEHYKHTICKAISDYLYVKQSKDFDKFKCEFIESLYGNSSSVYCVFIVIHFLSSMYITKADLNLTKLISKLKIREEATVQIIFYQYMKSTNYPKKLLHSG